MKLLFVTKGTGAEILTVLPSLVFHLKGLFIGTVI